MKKLIFTLIIILIVALRSLSQPAWVWQNPLPTGNDLNTVYFINSSTGFTCGNNGTVLRTSNGGVNWSVINPGTSDNVQSIFFTDQNTGYMGIGRFQGLMLKTTNAGLNWTTENLGIQYGPRSINFINANTGVAAFQTANILLTTNAGLNWQQIPTSISYNTCIWAVSGTTFYSAGSSSVSKTTNGGINWVTQSLGAGEDVLSICFTDSLNGILCGRQSLIRRTTNGGTTWDIITSGAFGDIFSVRYVNSQNVFASAQGGGVLKSTNGGINWSLSYIPETYFNNLLSVMPLNSNDIFISGAFGSVCKSTNGGTNWLQLFGVINNDIYYSNFADDNNGYAASSNGVIKTSNGGTNWAKLTSVSIGGPIYFRNANTGFLAAMSSGIMYKTTNGGVNFNTVLTGYPSTFRAFSFINDNTGFTVTSSGKTLKTTNSGINWNQIDSTANAYYADIVFTDSLTGYISGMKTSPTASLIKKTTNGGVSWVEQTINSTLGITALYFVNNNTGFAGSNNSGQNFFKTTNGGLNWVAGASVTPYVTDLTFVNENIGYASSMFGNFYRTTNGGLNWIQLTVPSQNNINSIYHNNNSGITYLLGSGGMILKSTNGSITGFEQTGNNNPTEYYLEQNYPNPFNPNTNIRFQIPEDGYVTLKVYNITGQETAELINSRLTAGNYDIDFNAANLSSGIYFYRIETARYSETRKMTLIK